MKIRNDSAHPELPAGLVEKLEDFRAHRGFNVEEYVQSKTELLTSYIEKYNLGTVVIGVSGGIDSALVLALAARTKLEIYPVQLPAFNHSGVTGQDSATARGRELTDAFGLVPVLMDMKPAVEAIDSTVLRSLSESGRDFVKSDWGTGQLVSYARTPALYYIATVLTDNGHKAFILGTTNYSEGSYLGYIGKASDAMVDVQLISDLYKSEVYKVAEYLGVPESILQVTPTGDMFDSTSDEDVFGASYDFVELYLEYLALSPEDRTAFKESLDKESLDYFAKFAGKLDAMHGYNKHKYLAGSPAVHLDVDSPQTYEKFWKKTTWEG